MTGSTVDGARDPGFEVGGPSGAIRAGRLDRGHRIEINSAATVGRNDAARMYVLSPQLRTMPRVDDASLGQLRLLGLSSDGNDDIPLSPQFNSANTAYTALAENDVATAQLTVRARAYFLDPSPTIRISVDGEQGSDSSANNVTKLVNLEVGDHRIDIEVTSSDRSTTKTYTLVVTRVGRSGGVGPLGGPVNTSDSNSALSAMSLSHGILSPSFDRDTLTYMARVANGVAGITITPSAESPTTRVHVAGELVAPGDSSATITLEAGVAKDIAIVGTAENGSTTTNYTLRVTRAAAGASANANLSSLLASTLPQTPSIGLSLTPAFAANTLNYTIDVLNEVTRITLFPSVADDDAVITIDGVVVPSSGGIQVELGEGSNRVDMLVTAADAVTTRTYTVITTRASINADSDARLNDLSLSNGTLTPAFHIGGTSYTATVAAAIGTVTVTPTAVFDGVTITVNSATVASGAASTPITLTSGTNSVTIQVRSADGTATRLYTVTVIRNNAPTSNLSPSQTAIANTDFTYTFAAFSDVDGHALSYTADNLPGWLTFDGPSRTFSGIPSTAAVTTSLVPNYRELTVTASDGFDSASGTFRLRVEQGPPLPPTGVTAVPGPTDEDQITVSWTPVPVEQNGASPVTLYAATAVDTTNPANTFDCTVGGPPAATTCSIYGLTTGDEYSISVTAFNGLASAPSSPAVFATPNARPSVANAVAAQTATVNTPFSFTLPSDTFTDDGPGALTYSSSGQPAWFAFDGFDTWSGTPDAVDDVGVRITVTATDGVFDETEKFRISVVAAPAFTQTVADAQYFTDVVIPALSLPSAVSTHPAALNYTLHPTDGEVPANSDGTFTPVAGLIFDPVTLTLSGAPTTAGSTLLRYTATDVNSAAAGLTFTVTVTTNTVPTDIILSPTPTAIDENVVANTIVGTLSVTDATPTGAEVYTVPAGVGGIDNGAFTITDDMLAINAPPDYETQSSYSIRIQVTDGALTYTKAFTITVNDLTETALFTVVPQNSRNLAENTEYTSDSPTIADNGSPPVGGLVWSLGGEDADDFSIDSATGVVTLSERDYEAPTDTGDDNTYQYTMIVTDMGASVSAESTAITIIVTDVNEAPTDIDILSATTVSVTTIDENVVADTIVGTLSVTDDALAGNLIYTLAAGSGDTDNGAFSLIGTTLSINAAPDFEAKPIYYIRIQVADGLLIYAKAFTIMVNDLIEAPIIANPIPNQGATVNIAFTYTIPADTFTDGDNDSLSYSSSGQPGWLTFTTDRWHGIPSPTASAATISVTADDGTGNSVIDTFTITVNSAISLQGVDDQTYTAGVAIPILTMPEASGGTALLTYSLTPPLPGLTFSPSDRTLSGTLSPTTATTMTYRVIDANGAEAVQPFTITVNSAMSLQAVDDQTYTAGVAIPILTMPEANGGTALLTYSLTPPLPGLTFSPSDRTLSGTLSPTTATTMTYRVIDANGAEAVQPFTITVNSTVSLQAVDDQTYTAGVAIPILTMPEANGGTAPLAYSLIPPLPGLTFSPIVRTLSGTPIPTTAASTTTMTCRVSDANGAEAIQTFTITINPGNAVSSELLASHERINTMILSNAAQAITAATLSKVAERMHAVDNPAAAYQFGGQSSLSGLLKSYGQAVLEGTMDVERLFNGASFVLPLRAAEGDPNGVGALLAWGGSEYRSLDSDEDGLDWDGEVVSAHLGVDTLVNREVLKGVALSWNRGRFDYLDEDGSSGEYQYRTNNIHPYFGWRPDIGFSLWATAGYGRGEITIDADDDAGNTAALAGERSTDTIQLSLAGGLNGRILRSATLQPGAITTVNLKSDFALVRVEVDEDMVEGFVAQDVDSHRMRLLLSGEQRFELAPGGVLTPSLEVGTRYDGGDGVTGSGVEWGLGLRYASRGGSLSVSGNIRTLLSHNYNERGADLAFRLSPPSGRGLSLSLHPTWGKTRSAADQLWHDGIGQLSGGDAVLRRSLDSEVGYGMAASLLGKVGVLTPYAGLSTTDATRRLRLGGRFAGGDGLILTLEGTQENTTDGVSREVRLRGEMAF